MFYVFVPFVPLCVYFAFLCYNPFTPAAPL